MGNLGNSWSIFKFQPLIRVGGKRGALVRLVGVDGLYVRGV